MASLSFEMSPPTARGKTHSTARGAPQTDSEAKLQTEVDFLQKKIKYLQSVSTIFRQKIALIMRECSKDPHSFPEYHRMYAKVLGEVTKAEEIVGTGDFSALSFAAVAGVDSTSLTTGRSAETSEKRREEVDKAHQLCRILQEKNEIKQREVDLRQKYDALLGQYEDICERHTRLVELQSTGGGGVAQAQLELFRSKEAALEKALMDARTDLARVKSGQQQGGNESATSLADGVAFASDATAVKQNNLLKARVERLKQDLAAQQEATERQNRQMQLNIETLVAQLHSTKRQLETNELGMKRLRAEKAELAQEVTRERGMQQLLQDQLANMEAQVTHLQAFARGGGGDMDTRTDGSEMRFRPKGGDAAELTEVDVYKAKVRDLESSRTKLQEELWRVEADGAQKDIEIASLGAQIRAFRARVEAFEKDADQRQVQRAMVEDVERRVMDAVTAIHTSQTTSALADQMSGINSQLQRLEGLELQLRQKEDMLAMAEDELSQLRHTHGELLQSLHAVSSLFMELPQSTASLERLVIEHGEYKLELHRCADAREPPDVVSVSGRIELRCLEAEAARRNNRLAADAGTTLPGDTLHGPPARPSTGGRSSAAARDASLQGPGDYGVNDSSVVPPPPPLIDLAALSRGGAAADRYAWASHPPPVEDAPHISEDDVRITFQLFDERGNGVLPVDVIRLCLTTLGLPVTLVPPRTTSMTNAEFLALCANRPRAR
jgi:hypothetical protein